MDLMSISEDLAKLNQTRYREWTSDLEEGETKTAIHAFNGEVYVGLKAESFTTDDLIYAQQHLGILSGLHGILRPLDLIKPYRLEMGTKLPVGRHKNLYQFWTEEVTARIKSQLTEHDEKVLINLASDEYFKAIDAKKLGHQIIKPVFKEMKNGQYKVLSFLAKKARGMMAAYVLKHRIEAVEELKNFCEEDYAYNSELSTDSEWIFTRDRGL